MLNNNLVEQLKKIAKSAGQEHIFHFWNELTPNSKKKLIQQILTIDFNLMNKLKNNYLDKSDKKLFDGELEPIAIIPIPATDQQKKEAERAKKEGDKLLADGKIAALLVAGGQGTRLGFNGPKGEFPAAPISGKSLFNMHADKILTLNRKYNTNIPWFIMTSEMNHKETVQYFEENGYFGLNADDVFFFVQKMIPAMDEKGHFFLDAKDHIFCNPNGHGGTLFALKENSCLEEMKKRGIEEIFYFQVDNVLIKICDPYFIGYHHLTKAEMSAKVISKEDPYEKVGVVGKLNGKVSVIEYSDLPKSAMEARNLDGKLKYRGGSIAIHLIRRNFVEKITESDVSLPYHVAHKKISCLDKYGDFIEPGSPNGYKFEMFVFDALPYTKNSVILEIAREDEFSPIKNAKGKDSAATAKRDLMNYYGRMMKEAGVEIPFDAHNNLIGNLEISPLFAFDANELKTKLEKNFKFNGNLYLT